MTRSIRVTAAADIPKNRPQLTKEPHTGSNPGAVFLCTWLFVARNWATGTALPGQISATVGDRRYKEGLSAHSLAGLALSFPVPQPREEISSLKRGIELEMSPLRSTCPPGHVRRPLL